MDKMCVTQPKTGRISRHGDRLNGPRLLLITSRKSHKPFHMTRKSLILDDLGGGSLRTVVYANRVVLWINGKS